MGKLRFNNRAEWLAGRRQGIGASEWAGIMRPVLVEADRCPYSTPYTIWCDKLNLIPERKLTSSQEWGLRHEPTVAQAVADYTGRQIVLAEEWTMYRADDVPYLQASPDSFQKAADKDGPGTLQIKTAAFFKRDDWRDEEGNERPPMPFQIQLQAEMRVTGCKWGSLAVLVGGNRLFGPYDFDRNEGFLKAAEPRLAEFWDSVLTGREPEIDGAEADGELLKALYPSAKPGVPPVELSDEFIPIVEEWQEQRKIRLASEKLEDAAKVKIAAAMKDAAIGILPDGRKITYPVIDRSGYTVEAGSYRRLGLSK